DDDEEEGASAMEEGDRYVGEDHERGLYEDDPGEPYTDEAPKEGLIKAEDRAETSGAGQDDKPEPISRPVLEAHPLRVVEALRAAALWAEPHERQGAQLR